MDDDDAKAEAKPNSVEYVVDATEIDAPEPPKLGVIPSYAINDGSRIEVTLAEHQLQESLAKNHFDGTSFEASV